MTRAIAWNRRTVGLGILALVLLLGMLLAAPATSRLDSGSTWHRGPAGYSAWYESLEQQGIPVQRWQRPVPDLLQHLEDEEPEGSTVTLIQQRPTSPETLLAVLPSLTEPYNLPTLLPWWADWLGAGHRLVVLGVKAPVTAAPFANTIESTAGSVTLETRRRQPAEPAEIALGDEYGGVVWRSTNELGGDLGGEMILAVTPYLAANAYLNQAGNFALLTDLVSPAGGRVWVDEYLHGYRDSAAIAAEGAESSWLAYLARTPLVILAVQAIAVTLLALVAFNRRLGQQRTLTAPRVDNSQAYIQALAGVLHKAKSYEFVVHTLSQAERVKLQKSLGLGETPVPADQLQAAWVQQTGRPSRDLAVLLKPPKPPGDPQLRDWLQRLQSLHPFTQENPPGHE